MTTQKMSPQFPNLELGQNLFVVYVGETKVFEAKGAQLG